MTRAAARVDTRLCVDCLTEIAPALVACPKCHSLVHASRLKELATLAEAAERDNRGDAAAAAWQEALTLLPAHSSQHEAVRARLGSLVRASAAADTPVPPPTSKGKSKWGVGAMAAALFVWKFKFVVAFIVTKGKLLLLGLSKGSTVLSMLASVGVYWAAWGLWFAVGFVASIYVHEMGHVAALRRYGVPATAPMFIPGLGAFIRVQHMPANAAETARIGLAGPLWGLGAAVAALAGFLVTGNPFWAAIAKTGAWINVFNLTPIWQLDGSRGFAALAKQQRWILVLGTAALWFMTGEGMLLLVLAVAAGRTFFEAPAAEPDRGALMLYLFLLASLAAVGAVLPASLS